MRRSIPKSPLICVPAFAFREILEISLDSGDMPEMVDGSRDTGSRNAWSSTRLPVSQHEQMLRDGRWLRHDDRRTPDGGAIGMRIDITDLKRREESFRLLFDANPMPMMVCDAATLDILAVNNAAIALYGFPARRCCKSASLISMHRSDSERLGAMTAWP